MRGAAVPLAARETKFAPADLSSVEPDGTFSGYASLFGKEDLGRDVVMPGAFAASLAARGVGGIRMLFQHDPATPIGVWQDIREDARGLFVRGRLTPEVAKAREVLALMRAGGLDGLSIGFRTVRARKDAKGGLRRLAGESRRVTTIDLPAVLDFEQAERLAETLLRDLWTGREEAEFGLPPSLGAIDPGDLVVLPGGATVSADRIEDRLGRRIHARQAMGAKAAAPARTPRTPRPARSSHFGPPAVAVVEYAPPDGVAPQAPRLAVFANPWPGTIAVYGAAEGGGFRLLDTRTRRATMGRLTTALAPGPLGVFDGGNTAVVALFGGTLASLPDIDVLGGGNAAAVRCAGGAWEILQFAAAELIGPQLYRLSRLLRGQCGTEQAMAAGAASGADFVLLDAAVEPLPLTGSAIGVPLRVRIGPARDDNAAPSFIEITVTPAGVGLRPFAPVHLHGLRDAGSGDIAVSWTRRTRFGGDSWALVDPPLNEAAEAYRVQVFDGATLKRQATATPPGWLYPAAEQAEDFGGPATDFTLTVAQLSATIGPGYALTEMIHV